MARSSGRDEGGEEQRKLVLGKYELGRLLGQGTFAKVYYARDVSAGTTTTTGSSVVFGICIAGCLTDSQDQRRFLMQLLDTQQRETVGNVAEVKQLMQQVWLRRDSEGGLGLPVNWRDVMRESQRELLLLV